MKINPDSIVSAGKLINTINTLRDAVDALSQQGGGGAPLYICRKVQVSSSRHEHQPVCAITHKQAIEAISTQIDQLRKDIADVGIPVAWE